MHTLPNRIELFAAPVEAVVERPADATRPGRVKTMGTTWNARLYEFEDQIAIASGDRVLVVGRQGITLLIVPLAN
jgi:membrane protein implicated in regulation of membrane protease activity